MHTTSRLNFHERMYPLTNKSILAYTARARMTMMLLIFMINNQESNLDMSQSVALTILTVTMVSRIDKPPLPRQRPRL